jgi:CMP-N-acetylneuraminic acid synthetase
VRIVCLVPARKGSTRVPQKNLCTIGGKTLVRRALETAIAADCFDVVALSSDDREILAQADGLDCRTIERPAHLATATARAFDAVVHAVSELEAQAGSRFDAVAIVQCTSPFTAPEDLVGAVKLFSSTGAGSVVSVVQVDSGLHPLKLKRLEGDRLVPWLADDDMKPSHELPTLYVRNGSVYLTRREEFDAGRLVAADVRAYVMPRERSHDIDTPLDLAFARYLAGEPIEEVRVHVGDAQ